MVESDEELIRGCQLGDERAFARLVDRHLDAMHAFLARRCPRWSLVEEVAQEAFVRAWEHGGRFQGGSSLRTWLFGIARNVLSERLRAEPRRQVALDLLLAQPALDSAGEGDDGRRLQALRGCLETVPPRARALLQARYQDERALNELARAYKKNAEALAREIQRLAGALRTCIQGRLA